MSNFFEIKELIEYFIGWLVYITSVAVLIRLTIGTIINEWNERSEYSDDL